MSGCMVGRGLFPPVRMRQQVGWLYGDVLLPMSASSVIRDGLTPAWASDLVDDPAEVIRQHPGDVLHGLQDAAGALR